MLESGGRAGESAGVKAATLDLKSDCPRCAALRQRFAIERPTDLRLAIRVVSDHLADGTLVEEPETSASRPFSEILENGPWDDVLRRAFRCANCGQRFLLEAETFHGGGGEWRPLED